MNKRALTLTLCGAMLATVAVSGTLAYFTDSDADKNVMTTGNIRIVQNETDRKGDAWSDTNEKHLVPAVYLDLDGNPYNPTKHSDKNMTYQGPGGYLPRYDNQGVDQWYTGEMDNTNGKGTLKIYDDNINNEIDKVISVTNRGTEDAYIRTLILMENKDDNKICDQIHALWGMECEWLIDETTKKEVIVNIGNTSYSVAVCTYDEVLKAGETSSPSLMQIFLDPYTTNEWYDLLGDQKFSILALSQACQEAGFENAESALNTAFGEVTKVNVEKWFNEADIDTSYYGNVIGGQTNIPRN